MRRIEWADKSGLIALEMVGYPPNLSAHKKNEYENRIRKLPKKSYSQRF